MVAPRRFEVLATVAVAAVSVTVGLVIGYFSVAVGYAEARLAYAIPTLLVIGIILSQLRQGTIEGLLTPITTTMIGFLFFFSFAPLLSPEVNSSLYSTPTRFWRLVVIYSGSVILILLGAATAGVGTIEYSGFAFLRRVIDFERLGRWYAFLAAIVFVMAVVIAWLGNFSPLGLVLQSGYAGNWYGVNLNHPIARYLFAIFQLLPISIAALSPLILSGRQFSRRFRSVATTVLLLCLLFAFGRGARHLFLYAGGALTLVSLRVAIVKDGRVQARRKALLLACGLVVIALAVQMGIVRTAGGLGRYVSSGNLSLSVGEIVDVGTDQNATLELVLESVPSSRPHIWGASYLSTFVIFIPRDLWPAKPSTAWAYMTGLRTVENPNAAYSNIGELYLNFGPVGVVVGMYLWGVVCEAWRRICTRYRNSLVTTVLYYMSLPAFAFAVRGDFQVAVGNMLYTMLVVFLVLRLSVPGRAEVRPGV